MTKNKHRKFAEINAFPNVVQPGFNYPVSDHFLKGKWRENFFHNDHPIVLEIGCGKGEYTTGLAMSNPGINYIGIDIKGDRLWRGARFAMENALTNVGFLRVQAEHLHCFFNNKEVDDIWVTFPDPQPNKPKIKKRLTSGRFVDLYLRFLKPGGSVSLKTDNTAFYEFSIEVAKQYGFNIRVASPDIYNDENEKIKLDSVILSIQTYYEKKFLDKGKPICFLNYQV